MFTFQTHIDSCDYTIIKCVHDQCTAQVQRSLLAKHLEEKCLYRSVQCKNCQEMLNFASIEVSLQRADSLEWLDLLFETK